jgi:hypothetical protein
MCGEFKRWRFADRLSVIVWQHRFEHVVVYQYRMAERVQAQRSTTSGTNQASDEQGRNRSQATVIAETHVVPARAARRHESQRNERFGESTSAAADTRK